LNRLATTSDGEFDIRPAQFEGRSRLTLFRITFFVLLLGLATMAGVAQTPTPTPTEEELKLQEEKRLLELKKDIELAKKAIRDAQPEVPKPTATPLEGNTTLNEGVRLETAMVSYKAMSEIANAIGEEIRSRVPTPSNFAIYDPQVIRDWRFHQALFPAFKGQTEDLRNHYIELLCEDPTSGVSAHFRSTYCKDHAGADFSVLANPAKRAAMKTEAITGAIGAGATLIKSFVDLAALFRTETKIEGASVTIDSSALVAEVFRALKNHYQCIQLPAPVGCSPRTPSFYYPGVFHPRIEDSETIFRIGQLFIFKTEADRIIKAKTAGKPALVNLLNNLIAQRNEAEEVLKKIKSLTAVVENLNQALAHETIPSFRRKLWAEKSDALVELNKLGSEANQVAHIGVLDAAIAVKKAAINAIDAPVKSLSDLNERFQAFVDQFVKIDDKGSNALALFIKSEDIERIMGNGNSYWLEIKSVSAGGNNRTRKNLIWFFAGARVDHSGGIVAEYTLYDTSGAVVTSDKIAYYEGYIQPKNIKKGKLKDTVR
jgi:hypothetical protein